VPVTKALFNAGLHVVGIDSAPKMLARFSVNLPTTGAVRGVAQALPFADQTFDGALAWGVMFHLPQRDQIQFVASVARILKPGGSFLFTSGDVDDDSGNHVGMMNGVEFHYYSFARDGYRRVLADHGLTLVDFHTDAGQNGYYLAHKRSC
jgi:SAM-dependent methyltransferase